MGKTNPNSGKVARIEVARLLVLLLLTGCASKEPSICPEKLEIYQYCFDQHVKVEGACPMEFWELCGKVRIHCQQEAKRICQIRHPYPAL